MAFQDEYDTNRLVNVAEVEVFAAIDRFLATDPDICRCQVCMLDVAALALNRMPAVYRATPYTPNPPGALSVIWDEEAARPVDLADRAVAEAVAKVRTRPHH
jgi:competence protein ComFB